MKENIYTKDDAGLVLFLSFCNSFNSNRLDLKLRFFLDI